MGRKSCRHKDQCSKLCWDWPSSKFTFYGIALRSRFWRTICGTILRNLIGDLFVAKLTKSALLNSKIISIILTIKVVMQDWSSNEKVTAQRVREVNIASIFHELRCETTEALLFLEVYGKLLIWISISIFKVTLAQKLLIIRCSEGRHYICPI